MNGNANDEYGLTHKIANDEYGLTHKIANIDDIETLTKKDVECIIYDIKKALESI